MRALLTLSTIGLAWLLHRSLKRVSVAVCDGFAWGDWPNLPAEAIGSARCRAGSEHMNATEQSAMSLTHRTEETSA